MMSRSDIFPFSNKSRVSSGVITFQPECRNSRTWVSANPGVGTEWLGTLEVLLGDQEAGNVIVRTDPFEGTELPENVELLPARRNLEESEVECRRRNKFADPTKTLRDPLERLRPRYDYIFLDTAPNASAPTLAAYLTADWFILSTEASKLSVDGLNDALMDIVNDWEYIQCRRSERARRREYQPV